MTRGKVLPMQALVPDKLRVLIRSSWQTVNIGDIAHTFGLLRLLEAHLPGVEAVLWPCCIDRGVRERLLKEFPALEVVEGRLDEEGRPDTQELADAWAGAALLVHGSGPAVVADDFDAWRKTGKPYVIFGVTVDPTRGEGYEGGTLAQLRGRVEAFAQGHLKGKLRAVLEAASFIHCRDTLSLEYLRRQGLGGRAAFGPDASFACGSYHAAKAEPLLRRYGLTPGRFICVVPRLRWTPGHEVYPGIVPRHEGKQAINTRTREHDHAALRELIIAAVSEGGWQVLLCPEMTYAVEVARRELFEPLPEEIRQHVAWLDRYWLHDEASAVYAEAAAVVSLENHSPILALAQGTAAIHIRQPTDTIKGQMWRDLGLDEWFFEVEETTGNQLWKRLGEMLAHPAETRRKVEAMQQKVETLQRQMVATVAEHLPAAEAALGSPVSLTPNPTR